MTEFSYEAAQAQIEAARNRQPVAPGMALDQDTVRYQFNALSLRRASSVRRGKSEEGDEVREEIWELLFRAMYSELMGMRAELAEIAKNTKR
jgi:hypothetical protein